MLRILLVTAALITLGTLPGPAAQIPENAGVCLACHGENGRSETPEVPSLGGQPANYLLIQLYMFREKQRLVEPMTELTKGMTDDDLRAYSEFVATLPPPAPPQEPPDEQRMQTARQVAERHRCGICHNTDFSGRDQIPRLAGQREDYLLKTLREYKSGARPGYEAVMAEVLQPLGDAELVDLAYYLSQFR